MEKFIKASINFPVCSATLPPKFESEAFVLNENKIRIRKLAHANINRSKLLSEKLSECEVDEPCYSLACAECLRMFRVRKINQLTLFCEDYTKWKFATFIYYDEMVTSLAKLNVPRLKDRLRNQLTRSGITDVIIGCFEADYHPDYKHWMPHFHLLIRTENSNSIEWLKFEELNFLRQKSPNNVHIIKWEPILFKEIKNPSKAIAYIYKIMWRQLHGYYVNGRRYTAKNRLVKNRFIFSLLKLDSFQLSDIEFMYGVRQYGTTLKETVRGKK